MKLYRGLKTSEFRHYSDDISAEVRRTWASILKRRSQEDWSFPHELSTEISRLEKLLRLQRQHFTDRRDIALAYAKSNGGTLLEIEVTEKDLLNHFRIEFQNFGKRKKDFEVVYVVDASLLFQNQRRWKMKQLDLGRTTK